MKNGIAFLFLALSGLVSATTATAQITEKGRIATFTQPLPRAWAGTDFVIAEPLPLPRAHQPISQSQASRTAPDPLMLFGEPRIWPGWVGSGEENPAELVPPGQSVPPKRFRQQSGPVTQGFGDSNRPYTLARVNAFYHWTVKKYPFRAAGKLFFIKENKHLTCSAALIGRGIVVTAAHCVANHGKNAFYSHWEFLPAYDIADAGTAPFGRWPVAGAKVLKAYLDGTDNCTQSGSICPDDIAILTLVPQNGAFAGDATGWFGYGISDAMFTSSGQALITELGYPGSFDDGLIMERNDAQGTLSGEPFYKNNTIIGSAMTDGSDGGPWLVNFGVQPVLSHGLGYGERPHHNLVVGVTSWGNDTVKEQGASPFTTTNITALKDEACLATPAACIRKQ